MEANGIEEPNEKGVIEAVQAYTFYDGNAPHTKYFNEHKYFYAGIFEGMLEYMGFPCSVQWFDPNESIEKPNFFVVFKEHFKNRS